MTIKHDDPEHLLRLLGFIRNSNRIEGIMSEPMQAEFSAYAAILGKDLIEVSDLEQFVAVIQPSAHLRIREADNVSVGDFVPVSGGPHIRSLLESLLYEMGKGYGSPLAAWQLHCQYEDLHPFTDGNGRSGRLLWLWMMGIRNVRHPFLHEWYYQTLRYRGLPGAGHRGSNPGNWRS